jgi:hypothetical protein
MPVKVEKLQARCPNCGEIAKGYQLQTCMICRSLFCRYCAVRGYGRDFCSDNCRAMFFFGDGDEEPVEDE